MCVCFSKPSCTWHSRNEHTKAACFEPNPWTFTVVMWGRELPRRKTWDHSRLMDSAQPLWRAETLAVHLRLAIGVCLTPSHWCPGEKHRASSSPSHTHTGKDSHVPLQWLVTVDVFVWDCVMYNSHELQFRPIPHIVLTYNYVFNTCLVHFWG